MEKTTESIAHMRAVTISREYGSGGGEIAVRLAERLNWQLIDHDIVARVAKELGISEREAELRDEQTEGLLSRILNSMRTIDPQLMVNAEPSMFAADAESYRRALGKVVSAAVRRGHVVIVGRASQVLLANHRNVLHARIVSPLDMRVAYVMSREGLDQNAARSRIQLKDRDRVRYLQAEFERKPQDAHLYDIVVNTANFSLDQAADLLCLALQHKAERLSIATGELGPVAGLPPYPSKPEDFRPPEK